MSTARSLEALRSSATNPRPVNPSQPSKPHTREDLSESESRAYCVSACASTAPRLSLCEARVTFAAARTQQHALSALAPGPGSHATRQPTTTPRPCQRQSQPSDSERDRSEDHSTGGKNGTSSSTTVPTRPGPTPLVV
jgi:hypothetical protein